MSSKKKNRRKNKKKTTTDVKDRSALAYSVKIRLGGAGAHADKRLRRNNKGRKYDTSYGWE